MSNRNHVVEPGDATVARSVTTDSGSDSDDLGVGIVPGTGDRDAIARPWMRGVTH